MSFFSSFNFIYFLVFTILLTSPLSYGSVTSGGRLFLELQAFLILLIYNVYLYRNNKSFFSFGHKYQTIFFFIFIIICILQIIPLPSALLSLISENSYEIWTNSQNILNDLENVGSKYFYTISLSPHNTWMKIVLMLSYFSIGLVISRTFNTNLRLQMLLIPIFLLSLFEASYGIYQYLSDAEVTDLFYKNIATGTFINRNNYAGLMEMVIPLILGYTLSLFTWREDRSFLRNITSSDNFSKQILLLFILGLMFLSLIFSLSRMGIIAAFLSLIFFWIIHSSITKQRKANAWIIIFVIGIVLLYGLAIGIYPAFERFIALKENTPDRVLVWADMLSVIRDFPIFGTGLGTFNYIYLLYNKTIMNPVEFVYAHNDYLQMVIEAGIPASMFLLASLLLFLRSSYYNLIKLYESGENLRFYLGLGAMSGVVAILIHSFTDFNLHIPSNAAYFAVLLGIMGAVGKIEKGEKKKTGQKSDPILETNLTKRRIRKKLRKKITEE